MFEVSLAPLCGISDHIFRTLCFEQGCDTAYTEMISAMGYLCAPNQRATKELMIRGRNEPRLVLQLFGKDPDTVAEAARRICDLGLYDGIDLNMGCPAKKVVSSGEGSALMKTPQIAEAMMRKTVRASSLPVSVKMRLGFDRDHLNAPDYARMAEDCGISSITVHGRTREQQYSGQADWETIARIKSSVRIPVIGNGDIFTAADAIRLQSFSRVDGIMIGRGAMGNPWIFRSVRALASGTEPAEVTIREKHDMVLRHYQMMLQHLPEKIAVREMRKHIGWYIRGHRGAGKFRDAINRCEDYHAAFELLDSFFDSTDAQLQLHGGNTY